MAMKVSEMDVIDDAVMVSALQHYSYCPRQYALIHLEQAFEENVHTLRGRAVHSRVDEPSSEVVAGVRIERALPVWSHALGISGICDVVEFHGDGSIVPVEYKHGPRRAKVHDELQVAAQAMCLEEMTNKSVRRGAIYHATSRRRREVDVTELLRSQVKATIAEIRKLLASGALPPPANDARCKECSLNEICQPAVTADQERIRYLRRGLFSVEL